MLPKPATTTTATTAAAVQSHDTKMRFGRCPHCRAMICKNPSTAIYYCSKCRTPIRGKNTGSTDGVDNALSRLEILSADTASVISDELDASCTEDSVTDVDVDYPPYLSSHGSCHSSINGDSQEIAASSPSPSRGFSAARGCPSGSSGVVWNEKDEVRSPSSRDSGFRPSSRRTRRSSSSSDLSIVRYDVPVADSEQGRRLSPLSTSIAMSGLERSSTFAASPLADPAFNRELLDALGNLRSVIDAIELPPPLPSGERAAVTPRDSRRLESERGPRRNGSTNSLPSSNGGHERERRAMSRTLHCLPVLGGAPFVVCGNCSELLQMSIATMPSRRGATGLRCGGCEEVLQLTLPAAIADHAQSTSSSGSPPWEVRLRQLRR